MRRLLLIAALAVLLAGGSAVGLAVGGASATPTANIFVDGSGGSCARLATPGAYNDASACGSINAANQVCHGGDLVYIVGGTYPIQNVSGNGVNRSADSRCTFANAPGDTVIIGCGSTTNGDGATVFGQSCLDVSASFITFDGHLGGPCLDAGCMGIKTQTYTYKGFAYQGRIDTERSATQVTFDHLDVGAVADGSTNTVISHSDLGPSIDPYNNRQNSNNVTWSDDLIHNVQRLSAGHIECLTDDGGLNQHFIRDLWRSCAVFGLFAKPVGNVSGIIDSNAFWNPDGYGTNEDIAIRSGSGATSCALTISNTWTSSGLDTTSAPCPGVVVESSNVTNQPTVQPPDPRVDVNGPPPVTTTVATTTTVPVTTVETSTAATTTESTTTTAPPPPYSPVCATSCDQQIADLTGQLVTLQAQLDAANANLTATQGALEQITGQRDHLQDLINQMIKIGTGG